MARLSLENSEVLETPKGYRFVFRFERAMLGYSAAGPVAQAQARPENTNATRVYSFSTERENAKRDILTQLINRGF